MKLKISIAAAILFGAFGIALAAPYYIFEPTVLPQSNNAFDLGTSTNVWRNIYTTKLCLSADCRSAWPSGGGSGTLTQVNTTYPVLGGPITTTGTLSLAFGTTTSNLWAATQTFTNIIVGSITGNAATVTTNANLSGVVTSSGNVTSYGSQAAGVLGNPATGNTAVQATSTLYGVGTGGQVLAWNNGVPTWTSTSTIFKLTTTGSSGAASYTGGTLNIPQYSGGGGASTTLLGDTNTFSGQDRFAFASTTNFEMTLYADNFTGSDIGAQVNAAYAALPANGGVIVIPAGSFSFSTEIQITTSGKLATIRCAPGGATKLTWTGAATSTLFNANPANSHFAGWGMDGCFLNGPDAGNAGGTTVAIEAGGSNGAQGITFSNMTVKGFGKALVFGINTYQVLVENSFIAQSTRNLSLEGNGNNSGEMMRFDNSNFTDGNFEDGTFAQAQAGTCVYLGTNAAATAEFTNDSFDDCTLHIEDGNLNTNISGAHFENPGVSSNTSKRYTYIVSNGINGFSSVSVSNSTIMNDASTTLYAPNQYILNSSRLKLYGVTFDQNSTGVPPAAVNNSGSFGSLEVYGLAKIGGNSAYTSLATSSIFFNSDTQNSLVTIGGTASTTALNISGITGIQCLHAVAGVVSGTGSDCGSGSGSGTVSSGTTGQFPFYNSAGTTLTATSSIKIGQDGALQIGIQGSAGPMPVNGFLTIGTSTTVNGSDIDALYAVKNDGNDGEIAFNNLTAGKGAYIKDQGNSQFVSFEMLGTGGADWKSGLFGSTDYDIADNGINILAINKGSPAGLVQLSSNGRVGIASTTPTATLSVQGNQFTSGTAYFGGAITATSTLTLTALTGTQCLHETSGVVSGTGSDCASGSSFSYPFSAVNNTATTSPIMFLASTTIGNGTLGLTVNGPATTTGTANFTGKVGIGTSSPETTLTLVSTATGDDTPAFTIDGTGTSNGNSDMELEAQLSGTAEANIDYARQGVVEWQQGIQNGGGATGNDFELWDGANNPVFTVNHSSLDVNVGTTTCQGETEFCVWGDSGASSGIIQAVTNASTTALIVTNGGNVGIGTSNPTSVLYVAGAATISQGSAGGGLSIAADVNATTRTGSVRKFGVITAPNFSNNANIEIFSTDAPDTSNNKVYFGGRPGGTNTGATELDFSTNVNTTNTGGVVRLYVGSNGNVGISTTSPYALLSLNAVPGTYNSTIFSVASSTGAFATSTLFDVNAGGNIGVGTSTPGSLLSIGNTTSTTGINFGLATSTFTNVGGINLTAGCYAIAGVCISGSSGSGTVTSVATNFSLTGGPISTTGTLAVATSSLYTGSTGQVPYFSGTNALIGTSTISIATNQSVTIAKTLNLNGNLNLGSTAITTTDNGNEVIGTNWGWNLQGDSTHAVQIVGTSLIVGQAAGFFAGATLPTNDILLNGSEGIGTTTPTATFSLLAASTTVGTVPTAYNGLVAIIAGLENGVAKFFEEIDQWGDIIVSGDAPTLTACTGGSVGSNSNQRAGSITVGTGLTTCGVLFAHPYPTGTSMHVFLNQDSGTAALTDAQSVSITGFTITSASVLTGDVFSYTVVGSR